MLGTHEATKLSPQHGQLKQALNHLQIRRGDLRSLLIRRVDPIPEIPNDDAFIGLSQHPRELGFIVVPLGIGFAEQGRWSKYRLGFLHLPNAGVIREQKLEGKLGVWRKLAFC